MQELKVFNYERMNIRAMQINGEPWLVGKDVAIALGYSNPQKAIRDHVDVEDRTVNEMFTVNGTKIILVNESGIYSLILSSKLPDAKKFKHWVTAEVLPTIRKTGGYINDPDVFISVYLPNADEQTKLLFKSTVMVVDNLNKKIEADKPKVKFAELVHECEDGMLIGDFAKILSQAGVFLIIDGKKRRMGQNNLFEWLRKHQILCKEGERYNLPTQYCMNNKWFLVKESIYYNSDGETKIRKTPLITGKGQKYLWKILVENIPVKVAIHS